jgi:hypothetical protein
VVRTSLAISFTMAETAPVSRGKGGQKFPEGVGTVSTIRRRYKTLFLAGYRKIIFLATRSSQVK